jgi:hypothetical protein
VGGVEHRELVMDGGGEMLRIHPLMAKWAGPNGRHEAQHDLAKRKHGTTHIRMGRVGRAK